MTYHQLEITRYYPQSTDQVYEAFTTAESLRQWWGPAGFEMEVKTFRFHPDGVFHFALHGPGGSTMWAKWIFLEISEPGKLRFINCFSDESGKTASPPEVPFGPDWPSQMIVDLEFYGEDGKTRIDMVSYPHAASEASKEVFSENIHNMELGFKGTFDQLEEYLKRKN